MHTIACVYWQQALNDALFSFNAASLPSASGTSLPSASDILKKFADEFVSCVHAKCNVLMLKRKGIVSPDIVSSIQAANDKEAKEILYDHLINHTTVDTLREWCEWAIDAGGHPKMQEFGRKLNNELT